MLVIYNVNKLAIIEEEISSNHQICQYFKKPNVEDFLTVVHYYQDGML